MIHKSYANQSERGITGNSLAGCLPASTNDQSNAHLYINRAD